MPVTTDPNRAVLVPYERPAARVHGITALPSVPQPEVNPAQRNGQVARDSAWPPLPNGTPTSYPSTAVPASQAPIKAR